jgi:hypothetical protein
MVIRRSLFFAGVVTIICLLGERAQADVITNGNFQTGTLAGWTVFTTGSNGTNGSGLPNVVSFNTTGGGASDAAHFNVGQSSLHDSSSQGGGLMQTIDAPVSGLYTLTESFASQEPANESGNGDAGTFSIIIDGTTVATDALGPIIGDNKILMGSFDETVDLMAGMHTFETEITRVFLSSVGDTPDQYIDNISLTPNSVTPEPSSLLLLGTGLVGVAGMVRRKVASHP